MASDEDPAFSHHDTEQAPTKSVYVGNIPYDTTGAEIRDCFLEYGPIDSVSPNAYSKVTRGYAFVNFYNIESAIRAVEGSHGRHLFGPAQRTTVTFQKSPFTFRLPSHKREYPNSANSGDEWFENQKVPKGPAVSANASSPRGPRSMNREISPPHVKRANFSMQGSVPRNHVRRSSYSHTAPRRSSDEHRKPEGYYEKSTANRIGNDHYFASDKKSGNHSRENERENEAPDQNEWHEIQALKRKARSLKASSTKDHWELRTHPVSTTRKNTSGAENSRGANGNFVESGSTTQDFYAPLEKLSRSRPTAKSRFCKTDDHSPTRSSSTSSLRRLRCADCKNPDEPRLPFTECTICTRRYHPTCGSPSPSSIDKATLFICGHCSPNAKETEPLTPSSPGQSHPKAEALTPRQPSPELGAFRSHASREFIPRAGSTAHHDAGSLSSVSKAKDNTMKTDGPSSDWVDGSHHPSSSSQTRRVEAARVAKLYKEVTCARWLRDNQSCKFTADPDQCIYAHHDTGTYIRAQFKPESARGFTCPDWSRRGYCPEPNSCGYAHSDTGRYLNEDWKPCTSHITCTFWYRRNRCKFSDDECFFAHYDTGQYASDVLPTDRNPFRDAEKDRRLSSANHVYIQKTSMNPSTPVASGVQPRNGPCDRMRPPAAIHNTGNNSSRSQFRETTLPQSDYFGDDMHTWPRGPSPSKPGYGLRHGVDTPHSPQPTISSIDGCSQHSATANSVVVDERDLQTHTKATPARRDRSADDDGVSAESAKAPLKPGLETQAPTAQKTNLDRVMPGAEGSIKPTPEKHFARPSAIRLDPWKGRKQLKATAASLPTDSNAEIAQSSTVSLPVTLCRACGKKLFGSGDHCNNCREKRVSASQAAAKIPTPAQSPSTVDENKLILDDINIPQAPADPAPRPESVQNGTPNLSTMEANGDSALQNDKHDTPPTGRKSAVTVIPAKRRASTSSPFISKKRMLNPLEGPKKTSSTLRERSKPKPSLEDLTQEALRRNSETDATALSQQTKDVNTSSHSTVADESLRRPNLCSRPEAANVASSERESHPFMNQEKLNATLEHAEDGSDTSLPESSSYALPKPPNEILSNSEPLSQDREIGQVAENASAASNTTSPSAAAEAQPYQSYVQNHNKRCREDEDELFARAYKYPRQERDGALSQEGVSRNSLVLTPRVTGNKVSSEEDENAPNDLDHQVSQTYDSTTASENYNVDDNVDEHGLNGEVVRSEGVVQQDPVKPPDQNPVLSDTGNRPKRVQADEKFDEAAHLERLKANGAMIEEESDEEEESDNEMTDAAVCAKTKEYQLHLGLANAAPVKVSRDLFEVAPHLRPAVQPAEPARYHTAGQPKPSKKELWKNLLSYQCRYRRKRFGNPHQMIEELPQRTVYATVLESAPQMANGVAGRPSIFDVAPVVEKKRKMTLGEFLGAPKDPVIVRDGPKGDLVFVEKAQLQNETKGRRVTIEKFPFIKG